MGVIDNFIKQYEKEYDFYKQLSQIASEVIENEVNDRALKALVSHRAKRIDPLREKLIDRNKTKHYRSKIAIEKDIVDLAGVRIALYFPSDRKIIDDVIDEIFVIKERKEFPENHQKPKLNKRFSGYWATHYRVTLKPTDDLVERFTGTVFEIQVASVLMHAWAEVEHDLVYKPYSGKLQEDELAILDEINGLVIAGEIALERLQKAITERTKNQKEISSKYELTNLLVNYNKINFDKIKLGNTEFLNNYLKAVEKIKTSEVLNSLKNINLSIDKNLSDQLLNSFINYERITTPDALKKYLESVNPGLKNISPFEQFIRTWIIFEKAVKQLNEERGTELQKRNFIPNTDILKGHENISPEEIANLRDYRMIRNNLLHGYTKPSKSELKSAYDNLISITKKVIDSLKNQNLKDTLMKEINELK